MTTAYTPILKLALPVTGELNGTWGTVVNDNITSMVEQAVAGLATINTWTTNSHTLTSADGTTSESRCAMLVIDDDGAGNPSAAATVICPTATKSYIVRNICGQTVTVKTSAGTGVAVPNNQAALVFCDGTNVVTGAFNGDVVGPATATNNAIVTFDGTTGKLIKDNSGATISAGVITATGFSGPLNGTVGATTPATGEFTTASATTGNITTVNATTVNATTVDTTNIEVTNLKAKDGTAAGSISDITGVVTLTTLASTTGNITTVNATTVDTTNIEVTNLKAKDGTAAGSIANATGVVTIASSVLTTSDINGGTIDGAVIGATTPAAGTFTNLVSSADALFNSVNVGRGGSSASTNVVVGTALASNTTGENITAVGATALNSTTTGNGTTAIGSSSLFSNTTGYRNTAVGVTVMYSNTTGYDNTAIGEGALFSNTTGFQNVAVGSSSLNSLTTGSLNTAIGQGSGAAMTTGSKNTIVGSFSGNNGALDIRTLNNYLVLSDGDGNPRIYHNGTTVVIPSLPTSATGLPTGALWKDGSGFLKVA